MRGYRQLIAKKFDGSQQHKQGSGRPRVDEEIEALVIRIAREKPSYGYLRIQGILANLGYKIHASTVRNILRRHHIERACLYLLKNHLNDLMCNQIHFRLKHLYIHLDQILIEIYTLLLI